MYKSYVDKAEEEYEDMKKIENWKLLTSEIHHNVLYGYCVHKCDRLKIGNETEKVSTSVFPTDELT